MRKIPLIQSMALYLIGGPIINGFVLSLPAWMMFTANDVSDTVSWIVIGAIMVLSFVWSGMARVVQPPTYLASLFFLGKYVPWMQIAYISVCVLWGVFYVINRIVAKRIVRGVYFIRPDGKVSDRGIG